MSDEFPRLRVDDRGIWCDDRPDLASGIYWEAIDAVSGYQRESSSASALVIELFHPSGFVFEILEEWTGFTETVEAMTQKLPGIPTDWCDQIRNHRDRSQRKTVWQRNPVE
ncbi:hypothetical protein [Thalassoroseus pseudoceratinae]|uniref:hypothetical protein n=1 Tax=Thalassoroseus pseudoceratinae TaxID=2713176 RepID=UPI0014222680|nr:hypothetical protein [Thalassoroseus pseudoceratinae]